MYKHNFKIKLSDSIITRVHLFCRMGWRNLGGSRSTSVYHTMMNVCNKYWTNVPSTISEMRSIQAKWKHHL